MANVSAEEKETPVEKVPSQEVDAVENDVVATADNGAPAEVFDCNKLTSEEAAPATEDKKEVYADEDQKEKSAAKEESIEAAPAAVTAAKEANGDSADAPDAEALNRKIDESAAEENGTPAEAFDCKKLTSEDAATAADDEKEVNKDRDLKEKSAVKAAKEESVEAAPAAVTAAKEANGDSADAPAAEALKRKMYESAAEEKGAPAEDVVCKKLTSENAAPATEDQKEVYADDDQKGEAKKESIEAAPAAVNVAKALKRKADESAAVAEAEASIPQKRAKVDVDEDEVSTEEDLPSSPPWVLEY
ncbi:brain acid soluble protein 1-like [Drosophila biarmipes]|uniref:brain acid soluble protein 1-like n=1 Tax=Drosophila biarmipes TaxID=125945 RepID=UPI001CDB0AAD|nr:brain acid soluble protein 1-like [Drosophila biarmipes]